MSKIDHANNPIDHGIAQGDDGIYAAQADAVYQVVEDTQTTHLSLFLPGRCPERVRPIAKTSAADADPADVFAMGKCGQERAASWGGPLLRWMN